MLSIILFYWEEKETIWMKWSHECPHLANVCKMALEVPLPGRWLAGVCCLHDLGKWQGLARLTFSCGKMRGVSHRPLRTPIIKTWKASSCFTWSRALESRKGLGIYCVGWDQKGEPSTLEPWAFPTWPPAATVSLSAPRLVCILRCRLVKLRQSVRL